MAVRRCFRWIAGRQGLLLCLLAALTAALAVYSDRLLLSYDLNAAQRALREGHVDSAVAILQRRAARGTGSPEWNYLLARSLRRSGKLTDAEKSLARARDLGWNPEDVRREALLTKARRGEVKKYEHQLVEMIDSGVGDETAEEIYEAMAQGYWTAYFIGDALQCLEFWAKWQPNNVAPQLWIADLYERTRRPEAAIPQYRKVLEIDPHNEEALARLGGLLLGKLELEEAAKTFVQLLSVSRDAPEGQLGLADCLRRQGANDDAKEQLFDALANELTPEQAGRATGMLGTMALEEHDYARAVRLLQDSVALDPNNAAIHVSLAAALTAIGQDEMAAAVRETAREMSDRHGQLVLATTKAGNDPTNPDVRCEAGRLLMEQGFWVEGADWIKTALAIDPHHVEANQAMADFYEHTGERALAKRHRAAADEASVGAAAHEKGG